MEAGGRRWKESSTSWAVLWLGGRGRVEPAAVVACPNRPFPRRCLHRSRPLPLAPVPELVVAVGGVKMEFGALE